MNYDSREAALGLLDLGSLGTGMDGGGGGGATVAGSPNLGSMQTKKTVPTKRKQGSGGKKEARGGGSATGTSTTGGGGGGKRRRSASIHWTSSDEAPEKSTSITADSSTDAIRCICELTYDDGFSITCDACSRWCHAACFDIVEGKPREVDRERAVRLQKARIKVLEEGKRRKAEEEREREREKRKRRASAAAIEGGGGKRRRRLSVLQPHQQLHHNQQQHVAGPQQHPSGEDEHVDIDSEPWTAGYIPISHDLVSQPDVRAKLRRHAQDWRGVTALSTPSMASQSFSPFSQPTTPVFIDPHVPLPQTHIKMLPPGAATHPALATHTHLSVHPPTYVLHTVSPVSSSSMIAKYTSCITPSSVYLSDPLNAYAHMGMPKPFVHVIGPPLDLALDARRVGSEARFARNGCRPNAVLRPVLCKMTGKEAKEEVTTEEDYEHARKGDIGKRKEDPGDSLTFGIFALQDIKANEEIVLGWEWDDGNVVHRLPALMENPHSFP
ncbi:hypothetical protein BDQ12DRAFT_700188 [Crucibulum laeve]|uniref:SET domain-containing protein n=1 Tax=Crucibulum laeve TaxID=68775 RepID=A0A5C3LPL0_9AGAR|nr:hypothetical protein BDQ12DRAFT_700188 [Crucibulum laeve]